MDFMDPDVCCPKKAVKLTHSLTWQKFRWTFHSPVYISDLRMVRLLWSSLTLPCMVLAMSQWWRPSGCSTCRHASRWRSRYSLTQSSPLSSSLTQRRARVRWYVHCLYYRVGGGQECAGMYTACITGWEEGKSALVCTLLVLQGGRRARVRWYVHCLYYRVGGGQECAGMVTGFKFFWPLKNCMKSVKIAWILQLSSLISRSHRLKNQRVESNLSKITRLVAAVKSLRFALFQWIFNYKKWVKNGNCRGFWPFSQSIFDMRSWNLVYKHIVSTFRCV